MKTIPEFQIKCKELFAARATLSRVLRKLDESPRELLQHIELFEEAIKIFQECPDIHPTGAFFESYLSCQDDIQRCIQDFREAIIRYNAKENNKKPLIPYLPLYTLQCTFPEKSYDDNLEVMNRVYAYETRTFTYSVSSDKFSLEFFGDITDAKEFLEDVFEEKFSEYCKFIPQTISTSRSSSIHSTDTKTTPVSSTSSTDEQSNSAVVSIVI